MKRTDVAEYSAAYQANVHGSRKREPVLFSNLARVMVRTPFWRVKSLIKDFIAMLLEEASGGVSRKAYCGEEAANDNRKEGGLGFAHREADFKINLGKVCDDVNKNPIIPESSRITLT